MYNTSNNLTGNDKVRFEKMQKEIKTQKGNLVLNLLEVVLLIDVTHDDEDFYWVYISLDTGLVYGSAVVNWIPLKNYIPEDQYNRLKSLWDLNYSRIEKNYELIHQKNLKNDKTD